MATVNNHLEYYTKQIVATGILRRCSSQMFAVCNMNFGGSDKSISGYFGTPSDPQCSWLLYNCDQLSTLTSVSKHPLLALCVCMCVCACVRVCVCVCINTMCAYLNWPIRTYVVLDGGLCVSLKCFALRLYV